MGEGGAPAAAATTTTVEPEPFLPVTDVAPNYFMPCELKFDVGYGFGHREPTGWFSGVGNPIARPVEAYRLLPQEAIEPLPPGQRAGCC